jgi:transcriptional regulator with XRE-family HTH domain
MSEIPTIGDVVREWRQNLQISLTDFCQQTKLSKGYVSELEHNKIDNPKMDKLEVLAKALRMTVMDIVSRRMPPKDGAVQSTPSSKQGIAGQGDQEDSPVSLPSLGNPAMTLADSLLDITFEQIEAIIESKHFSEEQMERMAAGLIDAVKLLARAIKPEPEKRKEG